MATSIDTAKLVRAILIGLAASGGGFGVAEVSDVLGAREWREQNAEALVQAERDRDRLVALEAQSRVLMQLVQRCHGVRDELSVVVPQHPDPRPGEAFVPGSPTGASELRWGAIE